MIKKYYITESAIIKRVYSVKAHSVEEAKENGFDEWEEEDFKND